MILLSRNDIREIFTVADAVSAVRECYILNSKKGFVVPMRSVISNKSGSFCFMPSYCEELNTAACKVVNVMPGNGRLGLPGTIAQLMIFDGSTGEAKALLDGTYVTALRTAAASGTAFELFGKEDVKAGAVIGAGGMAMCQLEAMLTVRKPDEIRVYDIDPERKVSFVKEAVSMFKGYGTEIISCEDADTAVKGADIVTLITPSERPVCSADSFKPGCVISAVGSFRYDMQELDPNIFSKRTKIYFDNKEAVLSESGDILRPLEDGMLSEEQFTGEIGDALLGKIPLRESDEEIIVYENVGFGALDLVCGAKIAEKALKMKLGTFWE